MMTLREEILAALRKHYGPGPHPDGTPQSIHAGGAKRKPAPDVPEGDIRPRGAISYYHGHTGDILESVAKRGLLSKYDLDPKGVEEEYAQMRGAWKESIPELRKRDKSVFLGSLPFALNWAANEEWKTANFAKALVFRVEVPAAQRDAVDWDPRYEEGAWMMQGRVPPEWITGVALVTKEMRAKWGTVKPKHLNFISLKQALQLRKGTNNQLYVAVLIKGK